MSASDKTGAATDVGSIDDDEPRRGSDRPELFTVRYRYTNRDNRRKEKHPRDLLRVIELKKFLSMNLISLVEENEDDAHDDDDDDDEGSDRGKDSKTTEKSEGGEERRE